MRMCAQCVRRRLHTVLYRPSLPVRLSVSISLRSLSVWKSLFPFDSAKLERLFGVENTRHAVSARTVAEPFYFVQFLMQPALFASPKALKNCLTTFFLLRISLGFVTSMNCQFG